MAANFRASQFPQTIAPQSWTSAHDRLKREKMVFVSYYFLILKILVKEQTIDYQATKVDIYSKGPGRIIEGFLR